MHKSKILFPLITGFLLLSLSTLNAAEKSALEIVSKAFEHTSSLDTYAFKAEISEKEAQEDGTFATYKYTTSVKVQRPNKIRIDSKGKYLHRSSTINNGLFTVLRHNDNTYSQLTLPQNIDEAIEAILHKYNLKKAPLASLVYSNISKHLELHEGQYIAPEKVDGISCDHVRFTRNNRETDVWVTQAEPAHIVAYHIKDTHEQPYVHKQVKITWYEKSKINSNDFILALPKGTKKIDIITEASEE